MCSVPAGITALQHLQHLGLWDCVTAPLPRTLSRMTQLTSLDITQDDDELSHRLFDNPGGLVVRRVFDVWMHTCKPALTKQKLLAHSRGQQS